MQKFNALISLVIFLMLVSCMKDDALWEVRKPGFPASEGLFVVNEGNFMYENASLSYYDIENKKVYNNVFFNTNALPLGDVAQSIKIRDSLAYVVMNNSGKIQVINTKTFAYAGKITGLTSPRHMHFISDTKAYVTDLYARKIFIIHPGSLEITGSIEISNGNTQFQQHNAEEMIRYGHFVFTNCWSYDNQILVIDSQTDQVVDSIEVLIQPVSMVMDHNDKLWVLTDGGFEGNPYGYEAPGLVRIDAESRQVEKTFRFELGDHPAGMAINGTRDTLYFINRDVYRLATDAGNDPEKFVESPHAGGNGGFYGLTIDPARSDVYVSDAIDLVQNGLVYRYSPDALAVDTFRVGIIPGTFGFAGN